MGLSALLAILAHGGLPLSLLAQRALRTGDDQELEARLADGMALIAEMGRPSQYRNLPAAQQLAEALIEAWRRARGTAAARRQYRRLRKLLRHLATYASIFPIGKPRLAWLRGKIAWYAGRRDRALALWRDTEATARALQLPYEELLANLSLSRALAAGEARDQHAVLAAQLREELGIGEPLELPIDLRASPDPG